MGKRNPNGYGCVTKLSGKRSRPWMVKVTVYDENGNGKQVPVDYAETEEEGNIILAQYNDNPWNIDRKRVTLLELYRRWEQIKLPKLGISNQGSMKSAFNHCQKYYGMKYRNIKAGHMQASIDDCGRGYSTQGAIKTLWGHLDKFAFEQDIISKMYSQVITAPPAPETSRTPFTPEQVNALWELSDDEWVGTVLIFIYTGFRFQELLGMRREWVNTSEWYFQNGSKTDAGKGRIVPIHPRIQPLVLHWLDKGGAYLFPSPKGRKIYDKKYYDIWKEIMLKIDAEGKTPHEARHTFETELDNKKANRKCIDLLMGHKSKDVGNRVYNHKTIEQLRETVNLLK